MLERTRRLPPAPVAERNPKVSTWHGTALTDDYAWLRADNWREVMRDPSVLDPKIRSYLEAENAYTKAVLGHTEALQDTLFAEMKGRIKEDDSTVPSPDGPYAYYLRYREGGQHPILCRQPREGGADTVMLDGDALAKGKAFFQLGGSAHSPDHRLLAWSADDKGSEYDTLRVRDLATGADLPDEIADVGGAPVWTDDSSAFYYVRLDANHRPSRVYRTGSVRRRRMTRSSTKRTTAAISYRSDGCSPDATRRSPCTTTRRRSPGCSISPSPMPSLGSSRRAKHRCSTTSSITRMSLAKTCW